MTRESYIKQDPKTFPLAKKVRVLMKSICLVKL